MTEYEVPTEENILYDAQKNMLKNRGVKVVTLSPPAI